MEVEARKKERLRHSLLSYKDDHFPNTNMCPTADVSFRVAVVKRWRSRHVSCPCCRAPHPRGNQGRGFGTRRLTVRWPAKYVAADPQLRYSLTSHHVGVSNRSFGCDATAFAGRMAVGRTLDFCRLLLVRALGSIFIQLSISIPPSFASCLCTVRFYP